MESRCQYPRLRKSQRTFRVGVDKNIQLLAIIEIRLFLRLRLQIIIPNTTKNKTRIAPKIPPTIAPV